MKTETAEVPKAKPAAKTAEAAKPAEGKPAGQGKAAEQAKPAEEAKPRAEATSKSSEATAGGAKEEVAQEAKRAAGRSKPSGKSADEGGAGSGAKSGGAQQQQAQQAPKKKSSGLVRLLGGTLFVGGGITGYMAYMWTTDPGAVRQLQQQKSGFAQLFETIGLPAAVKGPEFTVNRGAYFRRLFLLLDKDAKGSLDIPTVLAELNKLVPDVPAEEVDRTARQYLRVHGDQVLAADFVYFGTQLTKERSDAFLYNQSKKVFALVPVSHQMGQLLSSMYKTFDGSEESSVDTEAVREFCNKLDLGGADSATRILSEVEFPHSSTNGGMSESDFVNFIAHLLEEVPEERRVDKLRNQLKIWRSKQRERERERERLRELEEHHRRKMEEEAAYRAQRAAAMAAASGAAPAVQEGEPAVDAAAEAAEEKPAASSGGGFDWTFGLSRLWGR